MSNQIHLTTKITKFHNFCYCCVKNGALFLLLLVFMANTLAVTATQSTSSTSSMMDDGNSQATDVDLKGKLVFAHVIYRHGDRTPIDPYPTDPWRDVKQWPTGWGQLTNIGKQQHYHLGQWLRKRYGSLLSDTYNKDEIYIRSTDVDRTLMSALSNLAGLYEPVKKDVWNPEIHWQPIPVHTQLEKSDPVLAGKAPCPAYEYALSALKNSPEMQALNDRYAYLYNYLTKYTGMTVDSLEYVQRINNTLFIEELYNKTLPEWTKKVYPSTDMTYIADFTFSLSTYTRQMARLKAGPLIKEMLERFVDKSKGKLNPNRSLWIYSAHDTTVANVLNTLKLYDLHSPPYIACIMLELRLDEKLQPYVSIFYKNTTAEPEPLYIPDCGVACPLNQMFNIYSDILPKDWESECKLSTLMMTYEEANVGTAMGILVAIITIMLFLSYVVMIYYRRRSYKNHYSYIQQSKLDA
ncbi:prostatic acid phosphatase isoform X1 [Lucilia cuprina]|uniref:prostatic acid phosphatase isoform X1 n=1 Tax=Lucilia cuprina TaxID=7375 RepID=UPI001F068C6F|nr:prostatic acid phosphatase isoform X1 [Lucilia cuprina]